MPVLRKVIKITYSYTQLASYLRCPRSYRYRYLDSWREKEIRAALAFGRCFEKALAAYFCGDDCGATMFKEWGAFRNFPFATKRERLIRNSKFVLKHPPDSVLAYVKGLRVTNNKPVTVTASIGGTGTWLGRCGEQ
jgi:hypothetical protein